LSRALRVAISRNRLVAKSSFKEVSFRNNIENHKKNSPSLSQVMSAARLKSGAERRQSRWFIKGAPRFSPYRRFAHSPVRRAAICYAANQKNARTAFAVRALS